MVPKQNSCPGKRGKSDGIRDTAEAKWKKWNTSERPSLSYILEEATFGRRSAIGMEPYR